MVFGAALAALVLGAAAIHVVEDGAKKEYGGGPHVMYRHVKGRALSATPHPQRVLVYGTDAEGVFPRYHHIAKTGISSIMKLLDAAIQDAHAWERYAANSGAFEKRPADFQIASIRNPCNYYVSLWAYNAEHAAANVAKELGRQGQQFFADVSEDKGSASDIGKFRGFVRAISGDIGAYTGRLAFGMVPYIFNGQKAMETNFTTTWMGSQKAAEVKQRLGAFNNSQVDCWVSTETLREDMTECMTKLSRDYGWSVHWGKFESMLASLDSKKNPSKHKQCKLYYDAATERFVREKDSVVFDHFAFDKCCDQGSNLATHLKGHASA